MRGYKQKTPRMWRLTIIKLLDSSLDKFYLIFNMSANSLPRKIVKTLLVPFPRLREYLQTIAMAKDIYTNNWAINNEPEIFWIKSILNSGDIAIDVGANYGLYTYNLSKAVGDNGFVYAFEPIPYTFSCLTRIIKLFRLKNVEIINKGCSDSEGKIKFSIPLQKNGTISAGLAFIDMDEKKRSIRLSKGDHSDIITKELDIIKIDDLDYNKVSFIKVDVEGAELKVLKGAINTIKNLRPIIMIEIEDRWIESYNIKREDIDSFFNDLNYQTHHYSDGILVKCDINSTKINNFIFIPQDHKVIA